MARIQDDTFDERRSALLEILADTSNPAWDVVDRTATISALDRFDSLAHLERRQLSGAITAAIWMEGDVP
jgi:hypothetical protein